MTSLRFPCAHFMPALKSLGFLFPTFLLCSFLSSCTTQTAASVPLQAEGFDQQQYSENTYDLINPTDMAPRRLDVILPTRRFEAEGYPKLSVFVKPGKSHTFRICRFDQNANGFSNKNGNAPVGWRWRNGTLRIDLSRNLEYYPHATAVVLVLVIPIEWIQDSEEIRVTPATTHLAGTLRFYKKKEFHNFWTELPELGKIPPGFEEELQNLADGNLYFPQDLRAIVSSEPALEHATKKSSR